MIIAAGLVALGVLSRPSLAVFSIDRFRRRRRRRRRRSQVDVMLIARLLALSIASGQPIGSGLIEIVSLLPSTEAEAVEKVIGRARSVGLARAMVETSGPLADLAARLAQAHLSGAPAAAALEAFVASMHDAERYRSIEEARIVGVKLTVPLTLLLLPGFVLLTIAPFVVEQLGPILGTAR